MAAASVRHRCPGCGGVACVVVVLVAAIAVRPFWNYRVDPTSDESVSADARFVDHDAHCGSSSRSGSRRLRGAPWSEVGGGLRIVHLPRCRTLAATYPETERATEVLRWASSCRGPTGSGADAIRSAAVGYQLPITEPARGNAIHGLARGPAGCPVCTRRPESVTLANDLVPQSAWPFEVRVEVTYALHPEFGLVVTRPGQQPRCRPGALRCWLPSVPVAAWPAAQATSRSWCPRLDAPAPR